MDRTAPLATIAAALRRERERHGISLTELARRAGVAKSTLSQLESGAGNPSVETLWALAVVLEVPFSRLVEPPVSPVQVVRAGLAREGIDLGATSPIILLRHDPEAGTAEVQVGARRLAVELGSEELRFFGDCEAVEEGKRSRATRIVYRGHRHMTDVGDQA